MAQDDLPGVVKGGALLVIGAVLGAGAMFLARPEAPAPAIAPPAPAMEHDHAMHAGGEDHGGDHTGGDQPHGGLWEVPEGSAVPGVEIELLADPHGGWNLHLVTRNFRFAPGSAGAQGAAGEGHAHLYANGDKLARIYGPWHHIAALPQGEVEIAVTLNTHDHQTMAVGGQPISARRIITVE